LTAVPGPRTAPMHVVRESHLVTVPDVLHLTLGNAGMRLDNAGLKVAGAEKGGLVIQQVPLPGTKMEIGSVVHLTTGQGAATVADRGLVCPDFSGLSNRQINSLAARLGMNVQISGVGYAIEQFPAAGLSISGSAVKVKMAKQW